MNSARLRALSIVPLVIAGAAALGVAPGGLAVPASGAKAIAADVRLLDTESWIMGASGMPIPPPEYLAAVTDRFIDPTPPLFTGQPVFPVDITNPLFTSEGLYPLSGVKSLEFDTSATQGVSILNTTIQNEIADGNNVVVLGYSQSASIVSLEMRDLLDPTYDGVVPNADQLSFVLVGDPSNPDGGLLSRFGDPSLPPLSIPGVGLTFSGATPSDTPWDTAVYTGEYDGFADFPKYPINILADLNAFAGIVYVHGAYPTFTDEQIAGAIELPVSEGYAGHTQYFMIPTEQLPLLSPLRALPVVGKPLADLLEPDLRVLVNLGYGNIDHGWDLGPANVATPFGLFHGVDPAEVIAALVNGAQQGIQDAAGDLGSLSLPALSDVSAADPLAALDAAAQTSPIDALIGWVNVLTGAAATGYAALLPTADIVNFVLTTLPMYDVSIFANELASGDFVDAVGLPIAAEVGLATMAFGFELNVIANTAMAIADEFQEAGLL